MINEILLGTYLFGQVDKSMKIDDEAIKKNVKAFTRTAEAQRKLELHQKKTLDKIFINAKRKNALLICHLKMFQEQYKVIKQIQFETGVGIEELEKLDEIQEAINQYVALPAVASGKAMTDSQLAISFVLRGVGGLMIKDSEMKLKMASQNVSKANAIVAQIDSICIALDGIAQHTEIITALLEKLGMVYMKSIKNLAVILRENGLMAKQYSKKDIEAIRLSLLLTKLLYRIINTPIVDENGEIIQESRKVIQEGQSVLDMIGGK